MGIGRRDFDAHRQNKRENGSHTMKEVAVQLTQLSVAINEKKIKKKM